MHADFIAKDDFDERINEKLFGNFFKKANLSIEDIKKTKIYITNMIDHIINNHLRSEEDVDEALGLEAAMQENTSGLKINRRDFIKASLATAFLVGSGINPGKAEAFNRSGGGSLQTFMLLYNLGVFNSDKKYALITYTRQDLLSTRDPVPIVIANHRNETEITYTNQGLTSTRDPLPITITPNITKKQIQELTRQHMKPEWIPEGPQTYITYTMQGLFPTRDPLPITIKPNMTQQQIQELTKTHMISKWIPEGTQTYITYTNQNLLRTRDPLPITIIFTDDEDLAKKHLENYR
jgi:hypothetical protein